MSSSRDEEECEAKGERDSLLKKDDTEKVAIQVTEKGKGAEDDTPTTMVMGEPVVCERLIRARKSLTRCQPIDESFDESLLPNYAGALREEKVEEEEEEEEGEGNESKKEEKGEDEKVTKPDEENSEKMSKSEVETTNSNVKSVATALTTTDEDDSNLEKTSLTCQTEDYEGTTDDEEKNEIGNDEEAALDNLSASLSVIRMEKFALEKRRASRILHRTFVDPDVEQLFQVYHERQRRADLFLLLVGGILLCIYCGILLSVNGLDEEEVLPLTLFAVTGFLELFLLLLSQLKKFPEIGWTFLPFVVWSICSIQLILLVVYNPQTVAPRQALLWLLLFTFLFLAVLPLRLLQALLLSLTTALLYFVVANAVQAEKIGLATQVRRFFSFQILETLNADKDIPFFVIVDIGPQGEGRLLVFAQHSSSQRLAWAFSYYYLLAIPFRLFNIGW